MNLQNRSTRYKGGSGNLIYERTEKKDGIKTKRGGDGNMKIKESRGRRIFDVCNVCLMVIIMIVMIYPIWYVLVASFSDSNLLVKNTNLLIRPLGFTTGAYKLMMENPMIVRGYANTLFILVTGVVLNLLFTTLAAYFLSRKNVYWAKFVMMMIVVTMFFSGGLIPLYLTVTKMYHLNNSYWAVILPTLVSTYNVIIMRTSFLGIPAALEEAAKIDGAGHWRVLFQVVLPISLPVLAVITLYYAVGHWNAWFNASIFLKDREKYPIQLILREILINNDTASMTQGSSAGDQQSIGESVKYAVVVVATLPILCAYPFLQKYFVKGAMIGAVKG